VLVVTASKESVKDHWAKIKTGIRIHGKKYVLTGICRITLMDSASLCDGKWIHYSSEYGFMRLFNIPIKQFLFESESNLLFYNSILI
jgi:hypothetical protein